MLPQVSITKLRVYTPPLETPVTQGGRIMTAAGELAQIVNGEPFRFLAYLAFQTQPRGNHYHLVKDERMYILQGRLRVICQDIENNQQDDFVLEAGDLLRVQPRCAHVFLPLAATQALEFSPLPFDPADTYNYRINVSEAS